MMIDYWDLKFKTAKSRAFFLGLIGFVLFEPEGGYILINLCGK